MIAFSVGSCNFSGQDTGGHDTSKKDIITVSIPPQQYFVKQIAGNAFEINIMIPPGANPVTYDPPPGKMKRVANSLAYIKIGHLAFEKNWMNKFASVNPDLKIIDQSKYTELIRAKERKRAYSHNHGTGVDPHIWTSPEAVKQQIKAIKEGLTELDSSQASIYEINYRNFFHKLDSLDASFKRKISKMKTRSFMVFHPALSYYARDYNLVQIPIESGGKEPTPSELKNIIDKAKKERINRIFIQRQFNTDNAETIAKEVGAKVEVINPLDSNWINAMNDITTKLVSRDTLTIRDNLNE
jgi:zinc transport system substrate-binding protein